LHKSIINKKGRSTALFCMKGKKYTISNTQLNDLSNSSKKLLSTKLKATLQVDQDTQIDCKQTRFPSIFSHHEKSRPQGTCKDAQTEVDFQQQEETSECSRSPERKDRLTPFGMYLLNAHYKLSKLKKEDLNRSNLLERLRQVIKPHKGTNTV